jgi:6-phosphogluconolactonase
MTAPRHGLLKVFPDPAALHRAAAEEIVRVARASTMARGRFTIAFTGGTTPRGAYELLAHDPVLRAAMPWSATEVFFGDERCVPPDHPDSNYGMARAALLGQVPIPAAQVHRIEGEREPREAADRYAALLQERFSLAAGARPRFDLLLLGLGADGHVASLFPGTAALAERSRLVLANWVPRLAAWRVTLSLPVLNEAAEIAFLVAGEQKAWAVRAAFDGDEDLEDVPARLVRPASGALTWLVDAAAAGRVAQAT